jgi:hypothetical protein
MGLPHGICTRCLGLPMSRWWERDCVEWVWWKLGAARSLRTGTLFEKTL